MISPIAVRTDRTPAVIIPLVGLLGVVFMLGGGQAGSVAAILCGFVFFGTAAVGATVVRFLHWCHAD